MTLYGDLDLSVIDELPPDRLPVHTSVLTTARRTRAYDVIRREVAKGHQRISSIHLRRVRHLDLGAAVEMPSNYSRTCFQSGVGLLHGRLPVEERRR